MEQFLRSDYLFYVPCRRVLSTEHVSSERWGRPPPIPLCCTILVKPDTLRRLVLGNDGSVVRSRLVWLNEQLAIGTS